MLYRYHRPNDAVWDSYNRVLDTYINKRWSFQMCEQSSNRQNRRYCCEGIGYSCQINGGVEFAHGTEQLKNLQKTITSLIEEITRCITGMMIWTWKLITDDHVHMFMSNKLFLTLMYCLTRIFYILAQKKKAKQYGLQVRHIFYQ